MSDWIRWFMKKVYNEIVIYVRCVRLCVVVKLGKIYHS